MLRAPFDYPASVVEADNSVIFCLSPELEITYCNPAWDRFALENHGAHLCGCSVIGRSILDYISGPDRGYFANRYQGVLRKGAPWERDYECSSHSVFRKFRLRVIPMQKTPGLFVINSLPVETPHQIAASAPLEEAYRTANGFIAMCAGCRRTRRQGTSTEVWDWVPSFVEEMPVHTTHGICPTCREHYYPDED